MSEVRKCSETSQPQAFSSGPRGRQVGRAKVDTGTGQRAPPHPKVPLLLPFWCKLRRESTDLVPDLNSLILPLCFVRPLHSWREELSCVIKEIQWEQQGAQMSCRMRAAPSCSDYIHIVTTRTTGLKHTCWGIQNKGIPYFIVKISHISVSLFTHDYEFLFSMRELDSPHGL